jgi:hypothetical protein
MLEKKGKAPTEKRTWAASRGVEGVEGSAAEVPAGAAGCRCALS